MMSALTCFATILAMSRIECFQSRHCRCRCSRDDRARTGKGQHGWGRRLPHQEPEEYRGQQCRLLLEVPEDEDDEICNGTSPFAATASLYSAERMRCRACLGEGFDRGSKVGKIAGVDLAPPVGSQNEQLAIAFPTRRGGLSRLLSSCATQDSVHPSLPAETTNQHGRRARRFVFCGPSLRDWREVAICRGYGGAIDDLR